MSGTLREPTQITLEYLSPTAALPTRSSRWPPRKGNLPPVSTNKLKLKLAFVLAIATLQEALSAPAISVSQVKQAESTVDELCNCPLEGIPMHHNHAIIVTVFTRNTQAQIKMERPPLMPPRNPLIIEQGLETGVFGKILAARYQVEMIINTWTSVMTSNTRTAANPQQDVMIKPSKASYVSGLPRGSIVITMTFQNVPRGLFSRLQLPDNHSMAKPQHDPGPVSNMQNTTNPLFGLGIRHLVASNTIVTRDPPNTDCTKAIEQGCQNIPHTS